MDMKHRGTLVLIWMARGSTRYGMEKKRGTYAGLRSALPQCGIVALDCCFPLFVVYLCVFYNIFKTNLFHSCFCVECSL